MLITNSSPMDKVSNFINIYESMDWFGTEMRSSTRIKSKIERKHLHHKDISNLLDGNNNSHCSLQTLLLRTKYPIFEKYESLDWFGAEMMYRIRIRIESERKHLHHKDISNFWMVTKIPIAPYKTSPMDKVFNYCKIYVSLDWFGPEIRSRIRIKIENWKKTSAS